MVLAILIIAGPLYAVVSLVRPDGHMIYAGKILQNLPFKIYYSALAAANLSMGIGFLFRRRWSYLCFLVFSAYSVVLAIINIIATDADTLIHAGWKLTDNNVTPFHLLEAIVAGAAVLMALWLYRYRDLFEQNR
ncbi:MAG: hypothetical protein LLG97_21000 [Deltaproteobacteria bacterium]|nr:hypothetical protein [Deltaproteobacteria bacterium]